MELPSDVWSKVRSYLSDEEFVAVDKVEISELSACCLATLPTFISLNIVTDNSDDFELFLKKNAIQLKIVVKMRLKLNEVPNESHLERAVVLLLVGFATSKTLRVLQISFSTLSFLENTSALLLLDFRKLNFLLSIELKFTCSCLIELQASKSRFDKRDFQILLPESTDILILRNISLFEGFSDQFLASLSLIKGVKVLAEYNNPAKIVESLEKLPHLEAIYCSSLKSQMIKQEKFPNLKAFGELGIQEDGLKIEPFSCYLKSCLTNV